MAQVEVGMVLWRRTLGPLVISVSSEEYMVCDCDVRHGRCCSIVLDFPWGDRSEIPCPHTAAMDHGQYSDNLMRAISPTLNDLRSAVGAPGDENALVQDLFAFVMNFAMNRHSCLLNGPGVVPVAYISVAPIEEFSLAQDEARSIQESGPVWVKRATCESVEALATVKDDELQKEASCVICMEELKHDHNNDQIASMPCRHVFHRDCIAGWLNNSHVCPLCRFEMPAEQVSIDTNQQALAS